MADNYPDALILLYRKAEDDILADMARRLSTYDYWIPAAEHQRQMLREMGMTQQEIIRRLSALTGKSGAEINEMLKQACEDALDTDKEWYHQHGINAPTEMSAEIAATLDTGLKKTGRMFRNLTATTANAGQVQFIAALDRAWLQINSGAFSYDTAIRNACKQLAQQGVHAVRYPSGRTDNIEVAVRRAAITGVNQTAGEMKLQLADEVGCDLVETTAHAGARPEHAEWQGKVFSRSGKSKKYPDFVSSTGYGTGAGLLGWNCSHSFYPYVEGAPRAYTDEMLGQYSAKTIEYNGKMYTEYEATQIQRYHERQIRRWKREETVMRAAGQDTTESTAKIRSWQSRQRDFVEQTGLKRQSAREQISGFGKSEARKATAAAKKTVASDGGSGILLPKHNRAINDYISAKSYQINDALRCGTELNSSEKRMVRDLDSALSLLPDYKGTVYRSMSSSMMDTDAFNACHQPGNVVTYEAYTSTSKVVYDENMDIQLVIAAIHAKDISAWNDSEQEVLFGRNSSFVVTKIQGNTIFMEDIGYE